MFRNISANPEYKPKKGINQLSSINKRHQYTLGRNEWQQNWTTQQMIDFKANNV